MLTKKTKRTRITENFNLEINGKELRSMINQKLSAINADRIPNDARLFVMVPGGGDWSYEALDLDNHPIQIEWTVESGSDE